MTNPNQFGENSDKNDSNAGDYNAHGSHSDNAGNNNFGSFGGYGSSQSGSDNSASGWNSQGQNSNFGWGGQAGYGDYSESSAETSSFEVRLPRIRSRSLKVRPRTALLAPALLHLSPPLVLPTRSQLTTSLTAMRPALAMTLLAPPTLPITPIAVLAPSTPLRRRTRIRATATTVTATAALATTALAALRRQNPTRARVLGSSLVMASAPRLLTPTPRPVLVATSSRTRASARRSSKVSAPRASRVSGHRSSRDSASRTRPLLPLRRTISTRSRPHRTVVLLRARASSRRCLTSPSAALSP